MERKPSDENTDDDATNETPELNQEELENGILSDAPDETVSPPDSDGSCSDKNVINDSEPEPEGPPDAVSNADSEPNVETVADEQEQGPETSEPDEPADDEASPEEILQGMDIEEDLHDELSLKEIEQEDDITEKVEQVEQEEQEEQEQNASPSNREAEEQQPDEKKVVESIMEYIDAQVLSSEKELQATDSGQMAILAVGIVTTIIRSSIMPSDTTLIPKEPGDEIDSVPEGEGREEVGKTVGREEVEEAESREEVEVAELAEAEDEILALPTKVKMLDKAVQAIAREIDEALETLSVESLPMEAESEVQNIKSVESCGVSEGEAYQTCEETSDADEAEDLPCGQGSGLVPCPYLEQMDEETAEEKARQAVDTEDESQWEDLLDDLEETGLEPIEDVEFAADQQEGFELQDTSELSAPQDAGIPSEPQETHTPIAQDEEFAPAEQREEYTPIAQVEEFAPVVQKYEYTPSAPEETYSPTVPRADTITPSAPQDIIKPQPSVAPGPVRRSESSEGRRPAPPPPSTLKPRAVASDTQRQGTARSTVTPKREPREECEWQQAIRDLTDQFFESPYDYIFKFVVLCVAIRTIRNIIASTRCG